MDPLTIAILALRSVGTLFTLQGKPEINNTINALLTAYQAGKNVDAYMQKIADNLEADGDLASWDDITDRINDEVDEFLGDDNG